MKIPDDLTCLLRNLNISQEVAGKTRHGTTDWFKIGKGGILSPCLFNLYGVYIMRNARLEDSQAGRLLKEIPITSDMQMIPL